MPSKPPAFQFYARDWLSSTLGMPWDIAGLYIHLLAWSWDNGPLPNDPRWRQRIIGSDAKTCARMWTELERRWKKTARGWINPRLERQRQIQAAFSAHAQQAASIRWASPRAMPKAMPDASSRASGWAVPKRSSASASSSASADQEQSAAKRPISVPFKIYRAIALKAFAEAVTDDLGDVAEAFKKNCAQQGLPYDADITTKALNAARAVRKRA